MSTKQKEQTPEDKVAELLEKDLEHTEVSTVRQVSLINGLLALRSSKDDDAIGVLPMTQDFLEEMLRAACENLRSMGATYVVVTDEYTKACEAAYVASEKRA